MGQGRFPSAVSDEIRKVAVSMRILYRRSNIIGKTAWTVQTNAANFNRDSYGLCAKGCTHHGAANSRMYDHMIAHPFAADAGVDLNHTFCHFVTGHKWIG